MVSGASKGIGRAVAVALAREGVNLSLCARDPTVLATVSEEIERDYGVVCSPFAARLGNEESAMRWTEHARRALGPVNILVNNAGDIPPGPFLETAESVWRDSWEAKLFGYVHTMRAAFPVMRAQGGGAIVNVICASSRQPAANFAMGSAACAALISLTKSISNEGAPFGIRVNAVNPGVTKTEGWDASMRALALQSGGTPEEAENNILSHVPLRRLGRPEEVANAVLFLASDLAGYITGRSIDVDGGLIRGT